MYIEKVVIEGFKSYKHKTVVNFEPGLNVIVGPNGSGKTNLLSAIQFVLGNDFQDLPSKQREALLHVSGGLRSQEAYVEIIFNNQDRRFAEGEEVRLKREITKAKDQYFLDGKVITKVQVAHTLQQAGLSKTNPYYIIRQGKINELSTASNEKRLALLRDVSGSSVSQELHVKDVSNLQGVENGLSRLTEAIRSEEEVLENLEAEREHYRNWKELNDVKRILEYLHRNREQMFVSVKLLETRTLFNEEQRKEHGLIAEMKRVKEDEREAKRMGEYFQSEYQWARNRLQSLNSVMEELVGEKSKLKLELHDRRTYIHADKVILQHDLETIQDEIESIRQELQEVSTELNVSIKEENDVNARLMLKELLRIQEFARAERTSQFSTVEERNEWIQSEIRKLNDLIHQEETRLDAFMIDLATDEGNVKARTFQMEERQLEKTAAFDSEQNLHSEKRELELQKEKLQMLRNELWRQETEAEDGKKVASANVEQILVKFRKVVPNNILKAIINIPTVLAKMREREDSQAFRLSNGYRGLLVSQFSCNQDMYAAIDAVAGQKLFYHVVDTDLVAREILRYVSQHNLLGEYNFLPLNRLKRYEPSLPDDEDVFPMMKLFGELRDQNVVTVLNFVFGNFCISPDLKTAKRIAKENKINAVTLEGDKALLNGVLNGGYHSPHRSKMATYEEYREAAQTLEEKENVCRDIRNRIREVDSEINENADELLKLGVKINRSKYQQLEEDLKMLGYSLSVSTQALEAKQAIARKMASTLETYRAQMNAFQNELRQEFAEDLDLNESVEIQIMNEEILLAKNILRDVTSRRIEFESRKTFLQSKLYDHLLKKKSDIERKIQEVMIQDSPESNTRAIANIECHLEKVKSEISIKRQEIDSAGIISEELSSEVRKTQEILEKFKCEKQRRQLNLTSQREKVQKILDKLNRYANTEKLLIQRKKVLGNVGEPECQSKNDALLFERFTGLRTEELSVQIAKTNDQLKALKEVNLKVEMSYNSSQEMLAKLRKQRADFSENSVRCQDLSEFKEIQKDDALTFSLMQVANSFHKMFKVLVPNSHGGRLKWVYEDEDSDTEDENPIPRLDNIKGIAIEVSFRRNTKAENLNSLSGGQKSLVSLALVFAILETVPAPFYIFDEADMALDITHRKNVASAVNHFAKKAQFIAISFRPELLDHADHVIGVTYLPNTTTSTASTIAKEVAYDFVSNGSQSQSSDGSSSTCPLPA